MALNTRQLAQGLTPHPDFAVSHTFRTLRQFPELRQSMQVVDTQVRHFIQQKNEEKNRHEDQLNDLDNFLKENNNNNTSSSGLPLPSDSSNSPTSNPPPPNKPVSLNKKFQELTKSSLTNNEGVLSNFRRIMMENRKDNYIKQKKEHEKKHEILIEKININNKNLINNNKNLLKNNKIYYYNKKLYNNIIEKLKDYNIKNNSITFTSDPNFLNFNQLNNYLEYKLFKITLKKIFNFLSSNDISVLAYSFRYNISNNINKRSLPPIIRYDNSTNGTNSTSLGATSNTTTSSNLPSSILNLSTLPQRDRENSTKVSSSRSTFSHLTNSNNNSSNNLKNLYLEESQNNNNNNNNNNNITKSNKKNKEKLKELKDSNSSDNLLKGRTTIYNSSIYKKAKAILEKDKKRNSIQYQINNNNNNTNARKTFLSNTIPSSSSSSLSSINNSSNLFNQTNEFILNDTEINDKKINEDIDGEDNLDNINNNDDNDEDTIEFTEEELNSFIIDGESFLNFYRKLQKEANEIYLNIIEERKIIKKNTMAFTQGPSTIGIQLGR